MLLGPGINAAMQKTKHEVKHLQLSYCNNSAPTNNVESEDIKSAGGASLTQLQGILLQHLDDMQLETNILSQKIKQDHLYLYSSSSFSGSITKLFSWGGLVIDIFRDFIFRCLFLNIWIDNAKKPCNRKKLTLCTKGLNMCRYCICVKCKYQNFQYF